MRITTINCFNFLLILFLLSVLNDLAISQYKLTGTVKDSSGIPVTGISIQLNSIQKNYSVKTDLSGSFTIDSIPLGEYLLNIDQTTYNLYTHSLLIEFDKKVDIILTRKENVTEEILVERERPVIEISGDKKIFTVEQSVLDKGGNAIDVLRKVPMIEIDMNDNVSLRGSKNVKILIDNKPLKIFNLKQLSAENIKSIEVITNPSAKYEAEGVTGIINIVLKKNNYPGFMGNLFLNGGNKKRYSGNVSLNLKKDRTALFTNGGMGIHGFKSEILINTYYDNKKSYINTGINEGDNKYYFGSAGIEYKLFKQHSIGLEGNMNDYGWDNHGYFTGLDINEAGMESFHNNINSEADGKWKSKNLGFYYTGILNDKGHEISAELSYNNNNSLWNSNERTDYYKLKDSLIFNSSQITEQDERNNIYNAQIDYTLPLGESKFETGYKYIYRTIDNLYNLDTFDLSTGNINHNYDVSNNFILKEKINSSYITFSSRLNRFGFKAGIRAEHTSMNGEQKTGNYHISKDYMNYFPSLNLSYKLGQVNQISLNYSKRITRPMSYRLNPFRVKHGTKYISQGNPDLDPELTDSYDISIMFFTPVITMTPSAFFRYTGNIITSYSFTDSNNIINTTYRNGSWSKSYGLDIIMSSNSLTWMNLNGTLSFYNTDVNNTSITEEAIEEGFSWSANIRGYFTIFNLFKAEVYYNYSGKKFSANGFNYPRHNFDIGFSKSFIDNKLNASLRIQDVFNTMEWGNETTGIGYRSNVKSKYDYRGIMFSISYSFGNTKDNIKKSKKTKRNENENQDTPNDTVR